MPEDVAVAAESSPAAEPRSVVPDKTEQISVPKDPEAYAEWRLTGKLPSKPSKDESAPSKRSAESTDSENGAPDPETGNKQRQVKRSNADSRKEELNREIRDLLAKRDELRKEVSPEKPSGKSDAKPASSPAPEGRKEPVKPKQENFDTWDQYETALEKYTREMIRWGASQAIDEYEQSKRQETATRQMQDRLNEAKARYGDEAEPKIVATAKTVFDDQAVAPAIKAAIGRSAQMVDALYVMGSDENDFSEFIDLAKKDPLEALRKWFTVEALVKQELAKNGSNGTETTEPARGTDGKFKPVKPIREAPPPRTELGGTSGPPGDERVRAVTTGDFRSFKAAADARDLQRMRGR